jgi:hypothetical protein
MTPSGDRVFVLEFEKQRHVRYVHVPGEVSYGVLSRETLRAGMDAQYPSTP